MNKSVYIFGKQASGHTQWPDDSSSEILSTFYGRCKAPTQIIVHRDRTMMYYGYIRQLDDEKYIGLCVATNGCYVKSIDSMFAIYEKAIEKMAEKGVFIRFTDKGKLVSGTASFASEAEEADTLTHRIGLDFDALDDGQPSQLPPMDYTNSKYSVKFFSISDDMRDIVRATYTYSYTFIYKEKDFNTVRMNSYSSQLERLNKKIEEQKRQLNQRIEEQKGLHYQELEEQKRQLTQAIEKKEKQLNQDIEERKRQLYQMIDQQERMFDQDIEERKRQFDQETKELKRRLNHTIEAQKEYYTKRSDSDENESDPPNNDKKEQKQEIEEQESSSDNLSQEGQNDETSSSDDSSDSEDTDSCFIILLGGVLIFILLLIILFSIR